LLNLFLPRSQIANPVCLASVHSESRRVVKSTGMVSLQDTEEARTKHMASSVIMDSTTITTRVKKITRYRRNVGLSVIGYLTTTSGACCRYIGLGHHALTYFVLRSASHATHVLPAGLHAMPVANTK
jgi:hypothetical protein